MSDNARGQATAEELPVGDLIRILLEQHRHIRDLCSAVSYPTSPEHKASSFDELRELLAIHEAAEEVVLRPRTRITAGESVAGDRDAEEKACAQRLADLETTPIETSEFDAKFMAFAQAVAEHAEAEEDREFPRMLIHYDTEERNRLGTLLVQIEMLAPSHPHPGIAGSGARQMALGPFASLLDHARDALSGSLS